MCIHRLVLCGLLLMGHGCYFPEVSLNDENIKKIKRYTLQGDVKPQYMVSANIENQVELLGYDLNQTQVYPNQTITISYYLKGLSDTISDARIFVHLQGQQKRAFQNLDHVAIDGLLPIKNLKKGQIIKDVQRIRIKKGFPAGKATLYWGLYQHKKRLKIINPSQVKHDGKQRVRLGNIRIKKREAMQVFAHQLTEGASITLDGHIDESVWQNTPWTPYWVHPLSAKKTRSLPNTRAKFLWQPDALYIAVEAMDQHVWATYTKRDSNTWEQEVIEVFLDPDHDRKDYLELQVSPKNVVFDAKFAYQRSHLPTARAWDFKTWQTAVWVDGTLNQADDKDRKYCIEMKLPIQEIPGAKQLHAGTVWKINLFRFDFPQPKRPLAMSLSPTFLPDFHHLDAFATLIFK